MYPLIIAFKSGIPDLTVHVDSRDKVQALISNFERYEGEFFSFRDHEGKCVSLCRADVAYLREG